MWTLSRHIVHAGRRGLRLLGYGAKWLLLLLFVTLLAGNWSFATSQDVAYRTGDPASDLCSFGDPDQAALALYGNDEINLIKSASEGEHWSERLACAVQTHAVSRAAPWAPADRPHKPPLRYHLAFLEYREDGSPQAMAEVQENDPKPLKAYSQLQVLLDALKAQTASYVLVFVHGWRHDADIGDGNVADTRIYAASVARFIAERCAYYTDAGRPPPAPYCDMEVTAVYVGWRGARVDENKVRRWFGAVGLGALGDQVARIAMMPTLFDRKPVSELVGPAVSTALHRISDVLQAKSPGNRMIVFGHSLGGNMLMTAAEDGLVKAVTRHEPDTLLAPPYGNLIVLINPASEASHWTAIQRAIGMRVAYREADETPHNTLADGHRLFEAAQRPVVVSVTAAHTFPAGGIRAQDCFALQGKTDETKLLEESRRLVDTGVEYDWATYDLFPLFKGDLRPAAGTLARWAARVAGEGDPDDACEIRHGPWWREWAVAPVFYLAAVMRTAPFMTTDLEQTRTIGNLDPPRPAYGSLDKALLPAKLIGTTHELIGHDPTGTEVPVDYAAIGYAPNVTCPIAANWLSRARAQASFYGTDWRSDHLAPGDGASPAAIFIHGFQSGGMAPITRANDPFWNMRAFDNTLARHDGYLLNTFICAMNQLVLDDITSAPLPAPPPDAAQP